LSRPERHDTVEVEQALEAALDSVALPSPVVRGKHRRADDGVQSRGVTAAGGDGDAHGSLFTSHLLDGLEDLAGLGVAPGRLLGEYQCAVDGHLEESAGRLEQPNFGIRIGLLDLSRQTGSSGLVVSDDAVLDRHMHIRHQGLRVRCTGRES
jgi:hypothetical protein